MQRPIFALAAAALISCTIDAGELRFRQHDLLRQSTYSACAVIDVNLDGQLDIVCGAWWYEAPYWRRHFMRPIEAINGRFDGFGSLPYDLNRDGALDIISVNFRSSKLSWWEHPGRRDQGWIEHVVGKPDRMETGRLYDIDRDGTLDVLPNAVRAPAWWEIRGSEWTPHFLPQIVAGHGVGFGDINGDGRGDVVGPRGWLEAPSDPRRGDWTWNPEFDLGRASIPTLVYDVDADGDTDIVWGSAHDFGLYWLEQAQGRAGTRVWNRHAIDTSWSQLHALVLADLDGDGGDEIVVGKRYMAHEGGDAGAYDPLVIYWYRFNANTATWTRGVVSEAGDAGFGLDPKAADVDGDGDIDLVTPGRSGLFWFENLRIHHGRAPVPDSEPSPKYPDHRELLFYYDRRGVEQPVRDALEWGWRRRHILQGMERAMGTLPPTQRRAKLDVLVSDIAQTEHYTRKKITFVPEPGDRVPAYLLIPRNLKGRAPAMLCLHQTVKIGKDEPVGLGGRKTLHYAHELAKRGYVCIVPDYPSFGEYDFDFAGPVGRRYASGTMKAIWNNLRAVDLLESLPEADVDRIGVIGHSLGGHNAMFTAAFDQRLRAIVASCGFTGFRDYKGGKLDAWAQDRYMPRIRDQYASDPTRVPFDFHEVVAAFTPRAFFSNSPLRDHNFDVKGVRKVIATASKVYKLRGVEDRLVIHYPDSEHDFPDAMREAAYAWLDEVLGK